MYLDFAHIDINVVHSNLDHNFDKLPNVGLHISVSKEIRGRTLWSHGLDNSSANENISDLMSLQCLVIFCVFSLQKKKKSLVCIYSTSIQAQPA